MRTFLPPRRQRAVPAPAATEPGIQSHDESRIGVLRIRAEVAAELAELRQFNRELRQQLRDLRDGLPSITPLAGPSAFPARSETEWKRLLRNLAALERERDEARAEVEKLRAAEHVSGGRRTWPGLGGRL